MTEACNEQCAQMLACEFSGASFPMLCVGFPCLVIGLFLGRASLWPCQREKEKEKRKTEKQDDRVRGTRTFTTCWIAPLSGECFHRHRDCEGLRSARTVACYRQCRLCELTGA
eukprot:5531563-Amphidinium_carterae.1